MFNKAFRGLEGNVDAAAGASSSVTPVSPDNHRKPSNLLVRAALKRKRMASGSQKADDKKPA